MTKAATTEFAPNFGRYREAALREAAAVKAHDSITGYFSSVQEYEEYQQIKAMASTAVAAEDLDYETLRALSDAKMAPRHAALDHLMD